MEIPDGYHDYIPVFINVNYVACATAFPSNTIISMRLSDSASIYTDVWVIIRCHYTKSNPIDDHSNISSKTLQKQNFKPLGHYTCMQCGTSHLQKVQENILSHIILATYRKFTVATVRFTQNVSCNIFTHPIYQQVANVTV